MQEDDIDHIEELEKRLYARDPEAVPERKYGILHPERQSVESMWGQTSVPHTKQKQFSSLKGYRRFFVIALLFFVVALAIAFFSIYRAGTTLSSKNVEVTVLGNSFVGAGEELPLQVEITNTNAVDLNNVSLTLMYPKGAVDTDGSEVVRDVHDLGTIPSGKSTSDNFTAILYGEQGTSHTITAHLEYKLAGSNAVFIKEKTFSVIVNASPLTLTVEGPAATASNQPFDIAIHTLFNGDKPLENAIVRVEYPSGYVFQSSQPAPVSGNNVWSLGDMLKGTEQVIHIKGKLIGEQHDEKAFRVYIGTPESPTDLRVAVAYNSTLHSVVIEEPFISSDIIVGNADASTDVVAVPFGSSITGIVSWVNNAPIAVSDALFTMTIENEAVDMQSVIAKNALVDPLARTISWSATSDSDIATIAPGAQGTFPFSFSLLPNTTTPGDIDLSLSVEGAFPDRDYAKARIDGIDQKTVRFASQLQFASNGLFSSGPIKNTGSYPPKANTETTYTINWAMVPSQNPLTGIVATATLPTTVTWTGVVSPSNEQVSYNADSRTVTWNAGSLPKASGAALTRTVSFQVSVKPTKTQVGNELSLLGPTAVTATDTVAKVPLSITRPEVTTRLYTDPAYTPGKEKVLP